MRRGSFAAGLGVALCLAAALFAATPLYLPGVALVLIAAVAVAWVSWGARRVRVVRSTAVAAVEEHAPLALTVRVSRPHLALPGAELKAWSDGPALALPDAGHSTVIATTSFPRRGRHHLSPACAVVSDPLGLCRRAVFSTPDELLVLPRVEPVRFRDGGGEAAALGRSRRRGVDAAATEFDSLRPYQPGAPASRIHWPTVARTTMLMERRLVADADQQPLVVVDPRDPSSADALDQVMRAAASLCVHLARHGGCALLLPGDRRPAQIEAELHGWATLHARLALLAPGAGAPRLAGPARARALLWVTAATRPSLDLAHLRARVRYVVSPHPRTRPPVEFVVAGCSGQRLGPAMAHAEAV